MHTAPTPCAVTSSRRSPQLLARGTRSAPTAGMSAMNGAASSELSAMHPTTNRSAAIARATNRRALSDRARRSTASRVDIGGWRRSERARPRRTRRRSSSGVDRERELVAAERRSRARRARGRSRARGSHCADDERHRTRHVLARDQVGQHRLAARGSRWRWRTPRRARSSVTSPGLGSPRLVASRVSSAGERGSAPTSWSSSSVRRGDAGRRARRRAAASSAVGHEPAPRRRAGADAVEAGRSTMSPGCR